MYYPEELIEEVRQKNDIVDVISGYVGLQKKGKAGEREIDIVPLIRTVEVSCPAAGEIRISAKLSAGGDAYLNPEFLITAAKTRLGILSGDPAQESYSILRTEVYLADGETVFR